ncbi:MAG: HAD hydrolase-like protein, partial [candidate division KSB1 bacterium]|nr:HAD hydrolase-like protein [candidate division KSB1 bacterium]
GGPQPIFLLGTESLHQQFQEAGFETNATAPTCVVLGFDKTFTWEKFDIACRHLRRGVKFIATHPDLNCPQPGRDLQPDCGALTAALTAATGVTPTIIGKPEPHLYRSIQQRFRISAPALAMVGDRLETDIAAGARNGIFTILVLTGVTTKEQALCASPRPDLMLPTCMDLIPLLEHAQRELLHI